MSHGFLSMAAALASLIDPVPLDINKASLRELETLPGIGPATASAIVDFRESCGPILELDDLLGVPGIGSGTLARIAPHVTVDEDERLPVGTEHWLPVSDSLRAPLLRIATLDVGEGDAVLLSCPGGMTVLVDGGPDDGGPIVPPVVTRLVGLGIDTLGAVVMTHPHEDHIGGLVEVVRRFGVGCFYDPGMEFASPVYESLLETIEEAGVPYRLLEAGLTIDMGSAVLTVVDAGGASPGGTNEGSAVFGVTCGSFTALLAGDIEQASEVELTPLVRPVDFMLAPHHGSRSSAFMPFLRRLRPQFAAVSAGRDNPFGHPHMSVLEKYASLGTTLLRTDRAGTIFLETDGDSISVRTATRG